MGDWIVFPLLTGKGLGLPRFCRKAAPFGGLVGQKNICKQTVSLVLLTGICLLYSKGIIPVYLIVLFLLSGTIIGFLFRAFLLVIKVILILSVMGMLA